MLVLQSPHGPSLEQTEYLVRDRLPWMRSRRLGPEDRVPDANTLWGVLEAPIEAGALDGVFERRDRAITAAGRLPRGGQIVGASLVAAPRQRNADGEKAAIKEGKSAWETRPDTPRRRRKDVDGRSRAKVRADGPRPVDVAFPVYGYKSHTPSTDAWADPPPGRHRCCPARRRATPRGGADRPNQRVALGLDWQRLRPAENEDWLETLGMEGCAGGGSTAELRPPDDDWRPGAPSAPAPRYFQSAAARRQTEVFTCSTAWLRGLNLPRSAGWHSKNAGSGPRNRLRRLVPDHVKIDRESASIVPPDEADGRHLEPLRRQAGTVFGDPVVATAILDRLLHHSQIITIRGDSCRLRKKRRSGLLQEADRRPNRSRDETGPVPRVVPGPVPDVV